MSPKNKQTSEHYCHFNSCAVPTVTGKEIRQKTTEKSFMRPFCSNTAISHEEQDTV
jgi:hypothetical protein